MILTNPRSVRAAPADGGLVLGMIGVGGGRGHTLAMGFLDRGDCEIADIEEGHRSMLLVHYANISYRLGGRKLRIDPKTEQILDDSEAMRFFKRTYRKPWVVEEVV